MEKILLNDGNSIPSVGFGVFRIPNDGSTYRAVRTALDAGYRHIDTAAAYFNEAEAGKAVKDSGVPREEVFVTSKLWLQDYGFAAARSGTERSLKKFGLDYIDLYLLHQPYGDVAGAWRALEEAKAAHGDAALEAQVKAAEQTQEKIRQAYEYLLEAMETVTPGSQEGNVAAGKVLDNLELLQEYLGETGTKIFQSLIEGE